MYVNKCTKCGAEFETKNPKRVICPNCLYSDKKNGEENEQMQKPASYSAGGYSNDRPDERGYNRYDRPRYDNQRNYNQQQRPYGPRPYNNQRPYPNQQRYDNRSGYDRPQRPYDRNNEGYQRPQGGYNRPAQGPGGYNRGPRPGGFRPKPNSRPRPQRPPKQLLVNRDQLVQIEELYKKMLPLPNPDAHEVIGEQIGLEARKVFFGINLIRQKMMLPKLPYPKRKLAVSPDQLMAIKALYEPLLPLPPIGCHKIIAAQLKIDEWRVHVGIGLVRKQMGLDRWNPERDDAPSEFKKKAQDISEEKQGSEPKVSDKAKAEKTEKKSAAKARTTKSKKSDEQEVLEETALESAPVENE